MSRLHLRMLERAADKLGGTDALARYLDVPEARVRAWMRGLLAPSDEVFLKLVDLLSGAPPPAGFPVHCDSSRRRGKP